MELKNLFKERKDLDPVAIGRVCKEIETLPYPESDEDLVLWLAYVREWGDESDLISQRLSDLYEEDTAESLKLLYTISDCIFGVVSKLQLIRRQIIGKGVVQRDDLEPILIYRPVSYEEMVKRLYQLDSTGNWLEKI